MVRGAKPYITRSGLDPANSNLAILPALQSVLEQCEELPKDEDGSRGKDGQLLSKITKAYLKVEKGRGWEDRADEAYDEVNRREPEANMALLHACIREGVNESLLLGGQHRAAYFYAVSVPGKSLAACSIAVHACIANFTQSYYRMARQVYLRKDARARGAPRGRGGGGV